MGDLAGYWRDVRDAFWKEARNRKREDLPRRIDFVSGELRKHGFTFGVTHPRTGKIEVYLHGQVYEFNCWTGKITNYQGRGYRDFLRLLERKNAKFKKAAQGVQSGPMEKDAAHDAAC